jgi:4-diphosphocytidyl-2-C-methyl-D-erythritol kinase
MALDEEDSLTCDNPEIPTDASNLILKAAALFRQKTGRKFGVRVQLDKRIPQKSGLGGGSSNAATALWGLNRLLGGPASLRQLQEWSVEIGSDVPFFFSHGTAYCTGKGEIFRPLSPLPLRPVWIIKPEQGLSTPVIYQRLRVEELEDRDPQVLLKKHLDGEPLYYNDLEESAFAVYPKLALIKQRMLDAGFSAVAMTGSGSALFCVGDISPPVLPDVRSYPVSFLNRQENQWY